MPSRHRPACSTEILENRMLLSASGQGRYLQELIQQAAADLRSGYTVEKAHTLELLKTLTTKATNVPYYVQGEVVPAGGMNVQTVQSTPLIHLDSFRSDARFAGIDGTGFSTVIIDTGIDLNHPFFGPDSNGNGVADRIVYSYDFYLGNDTDASDFNGHGSNVASIAASSDSTYRGMAPGANIIALKVFPDGSGGAWDSDIQEALQWVVANAATYNIASVNLSLGSGNYTYSGFNNSYADEFKALADLNIVVAVASGNDYTGTVGVSSPSNSYDVVSVGAVYDSNSGGWSYGNGTVTAYSTAADVITPFTQRHANLLDIFAPGAPITGANATGGITTMHGTSQASPHIAGIAVLAQQLAVQELGRRLTTDEFRALLQSSGVAIVDGDDENDSVPNTGLTFRRVDVLALGNAIMNLRTSSISGTFYRDNDGNGTNNSEPALPGWTLYLDENQNGTRDSASDLLASSDVPKAISDLNVSRSLRSVSGLSGPITDVNVTLSIAHNFTSQLGVYLLSPWGERIKLVAGLSGHDFTSTTFDDEAATSITAGAQPFTGTYQPQSPLSALDGFPANGTWYLEVNDAVNGNSGTITSWSLNIWTAERSTVSTSLGTYSFAGVRAGTYAVREVLQAGWSATQPAAGFYLLTIAPDSVLSGYAFGNRPPDSSAPTILSTTINDGHGQRSMIRQIDVLFSEEVAIHGGFVLINRRTAVAVVGVSISFAIDPTDARLYRLTFSGAAIEGSSLPDGLFSLKVLTAGVADLAGNPLSADYSLNFHRLFGDFDGDRDVDRADQTSLKSSLNRPGNYVWYMDYDADGDIDNDDLRQFKARVNRLIL